MVVLRKSINKHTMTLNDTENRKCVSITYVYVGMRLQMVIFIGFVSILRQPRSYNEINNWKSNRKKIAYEPFSKRQVKEILSTFFCVLH